MSIPGNFLAAEPEVLKITVTNPDVTGDPSVDRVTFNAQSGSFSANIVDHGVFKSDGTTAEPGWTVFRNSSSQVVFSKHNGLNDGTSLQFRVTYTSGTFDADGVAKIDTVALNAEDLTNGEMTTTADASMRVIGVKVMGFGTPGATDGILSAGTEVNISAVIVNKGNTNSPSTLRYKVTGGTGEVAENTIPVIPARGQQDWGVLVKLSNTTGNRTFVHDLVGLANEPPRSIGGSVVTAAALTGTATNITNGTGTTPSLVGVRYISAHTSAPAENQSATITANVVNSGSAGALGVEAYLSVLNATGADNTSQFTITALDTDGGASFLLGNLGGATNAVTSARWTVAPRAGIAPDGGYNVSVTLRGKDENNNTAGTTNDTLFAQVKSVNAPGGFLVVDSTPPTIDDTVSGFATAQFGRGNSDNRLTFSATVRDGVVPVNASRVKLEVTLPAGVTPPTAAPLASTCTAGVCSATFTGTAPSFTLTHDFSGYELLAEFDNNIVVTDNAGNRRTESLRDLTLRDDTLPTLSTFTDDLGGQAGQVGRQIRFQVSAADNYRIGDRATGQPASGNLQQGVWLRVRHDATAQELFGPFEKPMNLQGTENFTRMGTYRLDLPIGVSGNVTVRPVARDPNGNICDPIDNPSCGPTKKVEILSGVDMYFMTNTGSKVRGLNYTQAQMTTHQLRPSTFGVGEGLAGAAPSTFQLFLENLVEGTESFLFSCRILDGGNLTATTACAVDQARSDTNLPSNRNHTVTITVQNLSANPPVFPSLDPADANRGLAIGGAAKTRLLGLNVTVPPQARGGEVGRIEFTAFSKFSASTKASVTLGFVVSDTKGIEFKRQVKNTTATTEDIKPTRTLLIPFELRNPGNLPLRYELDDPVLPGGWAWDWESTDPRWNDPGDNITLGPAGASAGANTTTLVGRITAPPNPAPYTVTTDVYANATDGSQRARMTLTMNVVVPTLTVSSDLAVTTATRTAPPHGNVSSCLPSCTYAPGEWTNFTLQATLRSTKNPPATDTTGTGQIQAFALVREPDGNVLNLSMSIVASVDGHPLLFGRNGVYQATLPVFNKPGTYRFSLFAHDGFNNDQFFGNPEFTNNTLRFTIAETPFSAPALSEREVREETRALTPDASGFNYEASFGSNVTVKVKLTDEVHVGHIDMRVLFRLSDGTLSPVDFIAMRRTQVVTTNTTERITSAIFEGTFRASGSFNDAAGNYQVNLEAYDATENQAPLNTTLCCGGIIGLRLLDLAGPTFRSATLTGAGRTSDNLDVETGQGVTADIRVTDNGDATPGSNVDPASVRAVLKLQGQTGEVRNVSMVRDPADATHYNVTFDNTTLAQTGTYTVEFHARDSTGRLSILTRTLTVLVNRAPEITVTSPPLVDGQRYTGPAVPVTVTVNDANLDANATGAIVVEIQGAGGNFTPVQPTITGAKPTFTVTIPVQGDANATFRVTATDTLGLSTTSPPFTVRGDNAAPIASIGVVPAELTANRAYRASAADPFFVAGATRLQVTATDAGSGVQAVQVSARPAASGTARTLNLSSPTAAFSLQDLLGAAGLLDGDYVLGARVTDRVGNAANAPEVTIKLDTGAPSVGTITPASPLGVSVNDLRSGVRLVEVSWATSATGTPDTFELVAGSGGMFSREFPPEATATVFFSVRAVDQVGNEVTARCGTQLCQLNLGNRPPQDLQLTITSEGQTVAAGGTVRGTASLSWSAVDPEGAQVRVTLKVRDASGGERTLQTDATLPPVAWNTTADRDGAVTVVLEATDGTLSATLTQQVVVRNTRVAAQQPLPASVAAGGSVLLAYNVDHPAKGVSSVVAVLRAGGQTERVTLVDDGTRGDRTARDGVFSATYTPKQRAQHTVDLQVTYAGETAPQTVASVGTFQAQGLAETVASVTFYAAIGLGVVAAVLGVFGLRRWR